ncbi:unnamed protein product [Rangifer tarandus platyrhynchus]|uniref:Uncharacterized protein n=2 Tax=Rangifer tarandus platyrhynchus TaxID=3082113 RepID=A0ABN8YD35_RANTA|nr:unnamed protein product [Rangifer tarandus platyrhynchus]CAI9699672.1 unnamed protein product [Rangifer tarandus platyrhynchus]
MATESPQTWENPSEARPPLRTTAFRGGIPCGQLWSCRSHAWLKVSCDLTCVQMMHTMEAERPLGGRERLPETILRVYTRDSTGPEAGG